MVEHVGPGLKESLRVNRLLFQSDFNQNRNVSTDFSENTKIRNFTKICPVRVELLSGRETDRERGEGWTNSHDFSLGDNA